MFISLKVSMLMGQFINYSALINSFLIILCFTYYVVNFGYAGSFVAAWALLQLWQEWATLWLQCAGFSLWRLLFLQTTGSRARRLQKLWQMGTVVAVPGLQSTGSIVGVHGLSCSEACGIFPDQGSNPCVLHWQANYLLLTYKGSHVEVLTTVSVGNPLASSRSLSGSPVLFGLAPSKIV